MVYEGALPITHKLPSGKYRVQFRKQIKFHNEWYTYMVWIQLVNIQSDFVIKSPDTNQQNRQTMLKRGGKITNRILETRTQKSRNEFYVNNDFINTQNTINKQVHTTTHVASTLIILSVIFLSIFLFLLSWYFIHQYRRRNRHAVRSTFSLVTRYWRCKG